MDNVCKEFVDMCICEFSKKPNSDEMKTKILNPVISYVGNQLLPYIVLTVFVLTFLIIGTIGLMLSMQLKQLKATQIST